MLEIKLVNNKQTITLGVNFLNRQNHWHLCYTKIMLTCNIVLNNNIVS